MILLFIGEKRSNKAIQMNVTWKNGKLAAKQLFDALIECKIPLDNCLFYNLWNDDNSLNIEDLPRSDITIGLGKKVQKKLDQMNIKHLKMIHPAARGKIRKKENYIKHVKDILSTFDYTQ